MYLSTHTGLGDAQTAARDVQIYGSVGAGAATAVIGSIASAGGSILGIAASSLVPIVGPALAAATMLIQSLVANSGCGQTCIVTSQWANQAAAALQQVKDAYFALPAPRTNAQKAVALANGQDIWRTLQQQCGQPGTGDAGKRCISDRQAGACTWHQAYPPTYPGDPELGACWNWDNGYFAAIRQDPTVPDASLSTDVSSILGGSLEGVDWMPLAVIGGLLALGVAL